MDSQVLAAPLRVTPRRRFVLVAVLAALAGAAVAAGLFAASRGDDGPKKMKVTELHGPGFALAYPAGWKALSGAQAAKLVGSPVAVVRRADGKGTVVVRRKRAPRDGSLKSLTRDLTTGL